MPVSLPNPRLRLAEVFAACREQSEDICRQLEVEDHVVQPAPFVSPPKWHLAHTTWFFDCFLLDSKHSSSSMKDAQSRGFLFNSYYKSIGEHWPQERRGHLSRPTLREIRQYRQAVTEALLLRIERKELNAREVALVELGIQHEQQHQELLLQDIKYILGMHPQMPAYDKISVPTEQREGAGEPKWLGFESGLRQIGHDAKAGFCFDNETPRHRVWLQSFRLRDRLVRNGEYLAFMRDGGYRRPELWLSDGWDWVLTNRIKAPLYWHNPSGRSAAEDEWFEYHLGGLAVLDPNLPVSHISYYEAAAFATWASARLPTEAELEVATLQYADSSDAAFWLPGRPVLPTPERAVDQLDNGLLWQWTSSAYGAYPGYEPPAGALGEYNGKFMSGQQVLRGGSIATPAHHWRSTYRNFYRPSDRWCFTGIRLAKDES